jgi:hypothetical protein
MARRWLIDVGGMEGCVCALRVMVTGLPLALVALASTSASAAQVYDPSFYDKASDLAAIGAPATGVIAGHTSHDPAIASLPYLNSYALGLAGNTSGDFISISGRPNTENDDVWNFPNGDISWSNTASLSRGDPDISPAPEPATWVMMLLGIGLIAGVRRTARRRNEIALATLRDIT